MKQHLMLVLLSLVLVSGLIVGCGQKNETSIFPTEDETETTTEFPSAEEWELVNRWLSDVYGLPPVEDIEQLQAAALLVGGFWFEQANKETEKLEERDIPWARTTPFCYTFNYYILHDIQLRNVSTPIEFIAADHVVADTVKDLQDEK